MAENLEGTLTREINSHRRQRFFHHLLNNVARAKAKKNLLYRASFVKKIDTLRKVEHVRELKEGVRKKFSRGLDVDEKIDRILEGQHKFEEEQLFERKMLSSISEREQRELDILRKVLTEEQREDFDIGDMKEKVRALQERLESMKKRGLAEHPHVQRLQERLLRLHARLGLQKPQLTLQSKKRTTKTKKRKK